MSYHPESSSIVRYIRECYPQFIAPIESVLWAHWETDDDIPDGKNTIWVGFHSLFMSLINIDNDFSIYEVDFFRDIKPIFNDFDDSILKSEDMLNIHKNTYEDSKSLFEEISIPSSIIYLDIFDHGNGTNFGQVARTMYFRFANAFIKADGKITIEETRALEKLKDLFYPTTDVLEEMPKESPKLNPALEEKPRSLDELLNELNGLIGLDIVKKDVQEMVNLLKVQKLRESRGMAITPISKHLVFYGNPGSGKTTIARLLSEIYKTLNVISKGHLVEIDRAGLVAGYVGQTALKVHDVVEKALGGILFIDEAYSLNGDGQDFGAEAIDTLLKLMEDNRNDLIVIVAGYTEKMNKFLSSNPGLKSRFNKHLLFEDYSPDQLKEIFKRFAEDGGFKLTFDAEEKLTKIFMNLYEKKDESFGNGRLARNLFENAVNNQANRIIILNEITEDILSTMEAVDIF